MQPNTLKGFVQTETWQNERYNSGRAREPFQGAAKEPTQVHKTGHGQIINRRARRWLPRKRDIRAFSDADIRVICDRFDTTPRKCLGRKTPAAVFQEEVLEEMQ